MCRAQSDGGRRCVCPPEQRRAQRRAKYAADKIAVAGDAQAAARTDGGRRFAADDLVDRSPAHLDALAVAWADRDADYAQDINAARMLVALDAEGYDDLTSLNDLWRGGTTHPRVTSRRNTGTPQITRTVINADGSPYVYGDHGWEQVAHQPEQVGDEIRAAGLLHQAESGEWLAYTAVEADGQWTTDGVVSTDLNAAGEALPAWGRDRLGLPERQLVEEVRLPNKADLTATMKDLRKSLVADDADDGAALAFAAEVTRMRLEAVARGAATDHNWSWANRALLARQAAQRGSSVVGWFAGPRQWDKADREVLPGAVPYEVWAPVTGGNGPSATADDEEAAEPSDRSLRDVERSSRVGFRAVKVYGYEQTARKDGLPDPDWKPSLPGGDEALYARMVASAPLPVIEDHAGGPGQAHGWTDGRKIVLNGRLPVGARIETVAHEHAHALLGHPDRLGRGEITREEAEQEAGLTAYLVVRQLGLGDHSDKQATANASSYLRSWTKVDGTAAGGHKARWRMLTERLGPATDAAHAILTRLLDLDRAEAAA
jgi:hypothetical protein